MTRVATIDVDSCLMTRAATVGVVTAHSTDAPAASKRKGLVLPEALGLLPGVSVTRGGNLGLGAAIDRGLDDRERHPKAPAKEVEGGSCTL